MLSNENQNENENEIPDWVGTFFCRLAGKKAREEEMV